MKLFKRIAATTLACLMMLSTLCTLPVSAVGTTTVAEGKLTQIVFGEIYTDADKGTAFDGNLYLEKNLGPAYFDGVRNGDWFEFKLDVAKAGDYHFCFSFGWVAATGTYSVNINNKKPIKLQNTIKNIN